MTDITVEQLAKMVGIPPDQLLLRLKNAGIVAKSSNQLITDEQKHLLLDYLKSTHTAGIKVDTSPTAITLKRKKKSTETPAAIARNVISVTVRKRRAYDVDKELAEEKRRVETEKRKLLEKQRIAEQVVKAKQEGNTKTELLVDLKTAERKPEQETQDAVATDKVSQ